MIWVPKLDGNPVWASHINDLQNEKVDSDGTASPSFIHVHLTVAPGTAPLVVTSPTLNTNLNADLLDGNHAAAFAAVAHNHDTDYISIIAAPAVNHFPYQTAGGELIDSTYAAGDFALVAHAHAFADLTDYPADAVGVLTNNGAGVLSWSAGGALALDDLTDVNAPAPNDLDVLAWDDLAGEWVAVPSGGSLALEDLTDVDFPSGEPDIGDVLTYESGGWTSMPGGGSMALDDLTDVDAASPSDHDIIQYHTGTGWVHGALPAGAGTNYPDPYLLLLLHFNGADNATTFPDSSQNNVTIARVGDAHVHQGEKKLGNASVYLDGSDYLTFPSSSQFAFGTGDFTIDFWVNAAAMNDKVLFSGRQAIGTMICTTGGSGGSTIGVLRYNGSSTITSTTVITDGTWHHCAIVRQAGAIALYVDGVSEATGTDTTNYTTVTGTWYIGENEIYSAGYLTGYLDEFRISRTARWTSGFTAPAVEYNNYIMIVSI